MANDSPINSMQANLGLMSSWAPPPQMFVSPAAAAQQMQAQASQQIMSASMARPQSMSPIGVFGQQFQQQLQGIQSQQSFNPYVAQALSGGMGGYSQGSMPSPLMMTPPSSGVFRPPPMMSMTPIPPQQVAPLMPSPFTPQLPPPMFQTAWDRELQQRDYRADRIYSVMSQGPHAAGAAAGIGVGAFAGAAAGSAFGPMGRLAGAIGGGVLAGVSGFAGGMGDMAMMPMRASLETHAMGASLQRMSQSWMLTGPQLHQSGAGFSRQASIDMGAQIRSMSADRTFRNETGGAFNREDLMKITETSGRAGLMDMEQGTEVIRNNLRQVSRVVKRFMDLTGDPDVTSIIREMGQMRAFGMSVNDMERAAQNMKTYARAAGTSIQGLQQMGGLPGAMTYQQAGLSAASGMEMGNYAYAAARQAVAMGTFEPRDLARMGGVSGVSQRNVQAQAALTSMPLFGAAAGGYGRGGWDVNYGNLAQMARGGQHGMGATGMVLGAVQNMGNAMAQGGIGALAEYQLRQGHMQDEASAAMHPAQQMAMRFKMAQQTGQTLGLQGKAAFTVGSRKLFGDDVAEQMMMEAKNPQSFREQAAMLRRQNQDIARQQRASIMANAPGTLDIIGSKLGISTSDRGVFTGGGSIGNALSDMGTSFMHNSLFQYMDDVAARKNGERINRVSALAGIENEAQRKNVMKSIRDGTTEATLQRAREGAATGGSSSWLHNQNTLMMNSTEAGNAAIRGEENAAFGGMVLGGASLVMGFTPLRPAGAVLSVAGGELDAMGQTGFQATQILERMSAANRKELEKSADVKARDTVAIVRASRNVTASSINKAAAAGARAGVGEDKIYAAKTSAANILAKMAKDRLNVMGSNGVLGGDDVRNAVSQGLEAAGITGAQKISVLDSMMKDGSLKAFQGDVVNTAKSYSGQEGAAAFKGMEENAYERFGDSGKATQESLAARARNYENMAGWGKENDLGAQEIRGKAREYTEAEFLGIAYASSKDPTKREEIWKRAQALGIKDHGAFETSGSGRFGVLTDKGKSALGAFVNTASAGQIGGYIQTKTGEAGVGLIASGAGKLGRSLGEVGLGGMTDEQRADVLSTESNMAKLSGMGKSDIVNTLKKLKGATGAARAGLLRQLDAGLAQGGEFGAGETMESLSEPEGEQAKQNESAASTLEGLANTLSDAGFDDFKDGAKDFVEGAKQLRQAMESDTMKGILEGTK